MITLYGIRNCDTVKKARAWLEAHHLAYDFRDYKVAGVDPARLAKWVEREGWEVLLNRAGTSFRKLPDEAKLDLDRDKAVALMLEHSSTIKRPVLEFPGGLLVGFKPESYARALL